MTNMTTITKASEQWASRPADQRFTSLTALNAFCQHSHANSKSKVISSRGIHCAPVDDNSRALMAVGPNGGPVNLTHWSFGQLAQRAGAPSGYLRDIPAPLAADCINYGLRHKRDIDDLGVLLYQNGGPAELRAVTGPNYGRIWNSSITQALVNRFGDGLTGDFRVPGEFGQKVPVTTENTTLYASDRDMFVFLTDETHRIDIGARRAGITGEMSRGFFVWNSEVGSSTMGVATFLFDYVCKNRIVWGAKGYQEIKVRHTSSAPDKFIEEIAPALTAYANSSTDGVTLAIANARKARVDNVDEFLAKRFSRSQVSSIKAAHLSDEERPIETVWDAVTGITAYARGLQYQDARVDLEREAGKILDMAS
jgi:Domain of unknown function (DUF932)